MSAISDESSETTTAVANEFVSLSRQGRFEEITDRLLSEGIVRVEP